MPTFEFVGVDGCRDGWFSVGLAHSGENELRVFRTFRDLLEHYLGAALILVDIPIGLTNVAEERPCDKLARRLLGRPRGSSVFRTPARLTVETAAQMPYDEEAIRRTEHEVSGKGISKQTLAIIHKIAEVDRALLERLPHAAPQVREVHPELCFWAFNGDRSMTHSKKRVAGRNERLEVLRAVERRVAGPNVAQIYEEARVARLAAPDDVLDALGAALTAYYGRDGLLRVPESRSIDEKGFPMEMVFWRP